MHTLNRLLSLLICCAILAACGGAPAAPAPTSTLTPASPTSAPAPTSAPTVAPAATTAPTADFPVTIENCGRSVTFTQPPERVVTTYQPATDILLALGLADRIVLAGGNYGAQPIEPLRDAFATLGDRLRQDIPKREEVLSVTPDFVFSTDPSYDFSAENGNATREDLAAAGVNIYAFEHRCENASGAFTSGQISDGYTDIRNIGRIFGITERAEAYIAQEQARIAAVAERVASLTPTNVIIYGSGEGPLNVYADGLFAELVERAGGINLFKGLGEDYGPVSAEVFLTKQPDIYVVVGGDADASAKAEFLFTTFPDHPASQAQRVLAVGDTQFYAGASAAFTVEQFARAFHPEAFANVSTTTYPVTLENCGRTLTFDAPPERVLVTYQNVAEILVALGLTDRIVGVTYGQAYDPPADFVAEVNGLNYLAPRGQGSAVKEVTLATQPDLVIAAYPSYDFDAAQGLATEEEFRAAGAQIFSMSVECGANPGSATIEDVYGDMLALGQIFGVEQRAQALVERMRSRIDAIQQRIAERPAVPVAFYDAGEDQLGVYGSGLNADMIRLAGGENIFADQPEVYLQVSKEIFATRSPSIFAVLDYEGNPAVPDEATRAEFLFTTFPNLPASQDQRWVAVSGAAFAAGIRIPDAVEQMARAFHPEAFE